MLFSLWRQFYRFTLYYYRSGQVSNLLYKSLVIDWLPILFKRLRLKQYYDKFWHQGHLIYIQHNTKRCTFLTWSFYLFHILTCGLNRLSIIWQVDIVSWKFYYVFDNIGHTRMHDFLAGHTEDKYTLILKINPTTPDTFTWPYHVHFDIHIYQFSNIGRLMLYFRHMNDTQRKLSAWYIYSTPVSGHKGYIQKHSKLQAINKRT